MAVELSYAKGSVQEAAHELGIDSGRITRGGSISRRYPWLNISGILI
jgi:hypothetical protein